MLERLLPGADAVIESGPLRRLRTLRRRDAAPAAWRHVVHAVVTPFGTYGPARDWLADDLVAAAAGGMLWLGGDPGMPPEPPPRGQAAQLAGANAAIAVLLALLARQRTGRGQLVEVSAQEAVAATLETGAIAWIHGATVPGRTSGVYGHVAHRVFAAKDGYVAGGYSGPDRMWTDLLAWMAEDGAAADLTDPRWQDPVYRWQHRPHVDEVVAAFAVRRTADEIGEQARDRSLPWAAVAAPAELRPTPSSGTASSSSRWPRRPGRWWTTVSRSSRRAFPARSGWPSRNRRAPTCDGQRPHLPMRAGHGATPAGGTPRWTACGYSI